ncbi:hypothetical protein HZA86_03005 [Candidatus Uhrbacteria bacterium]|nr:hypothetical protein [Candidatus Uhrbacteria bacterium]
MAHQFEQSSREQEARKLIQSLVFVGDSPTHGQHNQYKPMLMRELMALPVCVDEFLAKGQEVTGMDASQWQDLMDKWESNRLNPTAAEHHLSEDEKRDLENVFVLFIEKTGIPLQSPLDNDFAPKPKNQSPHNTPDHPQKMAV